jgi:twitching motility protein PilT
MAHPVLSDVSSLLELGLEMGASDLHYVVGNPPTYRISGDLSPLRIRPLSTDDFMAGMKPIVPTEKWKHWEETGDLDMAYQCEGVGRFRVNLFRQENGPAAVFRHIPNATVTLADLGMPERLKKLVEYPSGLVLVTGPTGSGKSTTLAALIKHLNDTRRLHILTIEDPVEFVYENKKCRISQREIGHSAVSFADALRVAVREDPDIILVGEMRDLETISMALQAAETGILVLSTMHTNSASRTMDRLINVFPVHEQDAVRSMFGGVLRGILAQQLLPRKTGGRVPAYELLFWTMGLPNMIRENKAHLIDNQIRTGGAQGMIGMDECILNLVRTGLVEPVAAFEKALDKEAFRRLMSSEFGVSV